MLFINQLSIIGNSHYDKTGTNIGMVRIFVFVSNSSCLGRLVRQKNTLILKRHNVCRFTNPDNITEILTGLSFGCNLCHDCACTGCIIVKGNVGEFFGKGFLQSSKLLLFQRCIEHDRARYVMRVCCFG